MTGVIGIASEVLRPVLGWAYAVYGLLLFLWLAWVAVALWRLARTAARTTSTAIPPAGGTPSQDERLREQV
jgi:hypothetical protein